MVNASPYLQEHIGHSVADALHALSVTQPNDPVDFVARYLKGYVASERARAKIAEEEARIAKARAEYKEEKAKEEAAKKAAEAAALQAETKFSDLVKKLEAAETWSTEWEEILKCCSEALGAQNACFGTVQDPAEEGQGRVITFEAVAGDQGVLNKELPEGTGLTWKCLEEHPKPDDYEGDDWNAYKSYYCDDITKDPDAHFFKWQQIGAFLAFPVLYDLFSPEAIAAIQEAEAAAAAAAEAAEQAEPAEGEEVPVPEPPKRVPSGTKKAVITFDTLETYDTFAPEKIEKVEKLIAVAAQARSRAEFSQAVKDAAAAAEAANEPPAEEAAAEAPPE